MYRSLHGSYSTNFFRLLSTNGETQFQTVKFVWYRVPYPLSHVTKRCFSRRFAIHCYAYTCAWIVACLSSLSIYGTPNVGALSKGLSFYPYFLYLFSFRFSRRLSSPRPLRCSNIQNGSLLLHFLHLR